MKKIIALMLALCFVALCFTSCNSKTEAPAPSDAPSADNTQAPDEMKEVVVDPVALSGALAEYTIVYGNNDTASLNKGLAEKLRDVISASCGATLSVVSDSNAATDKEILVGKTARTQSRYFFEGINALDLMEYVIGSVEGKIIVTGALLFSTEEAILALEEYAKANGKIEGIHAPKKDIHTGFVANKGEYRLMEYNVLVEYPGWGVDKVRNPEVEVRKEVVASMIKGYSPDVVVLCEMFDNWSKQLPELVNDEYTCVQWSRNSTTSNRTPILYKTERFNLLESGYTDIGVKDESANETKYKNYRCVTYAVLQDKTTGEKLAVFGTHLESSNESDRLAQVPKVKAAVDAVMARHSTATTIIMGDLNTAEYKTDNRAYVAFENTFSNLKNPVKSHTFASIQQVFVSKTATVNKTTIEVNKYASFASDHKPVIVDITTN